MPIFLERGCAFVHVPKTAGTSILRALRAVLGDERFGGIGVWDQLEETREAGDAVRGIRRNFLLTTLRDFAQQHLPAAVLQQFVGSEEWSKLFTFAFVRNPWEMLVSTYFFARADTAAIGDAGFDPDRYQMMTRADTFDQFVERYAIMRSDMSEMLCDEHGTLLVDFVGKFESLERDFAIVCERLGVHAQLTMENASVHGPYRDYYTDRTRRIVARHFARDIARFGYEF